MQEAFLHHVWKLQYFNKHQLKTIKGEAVNVIKPGILNTDAGPDFNHAVIKIGNMTWHGTVEIHVKASDWYKHNHSKDPCYEGVILHVVWDADKEVLNADQSPIPTLSLHNRLLPGVYQQYVFLKEQQLNNDFACKFQLHRVEPLQFQEMWDQALFERLNRKSSDILKAARNLEASWDELLYRTLAKTMGLPVNADPFQQLAEGISLQLLQRYKVDTTMLEALLFGYSGLLEATEPDNYVEELKKHWIHLQHKHQLQNTMRHSQWKFLRLRPANFPVLRIAQLAALIQRSAGLFGKVRDSDNLEEIMNDLTVEQSPYWQKHFHFNQPASGRVPQLGIQTITLLVINAIVPVLVAYSQWIDDQRYLDKALFFLEQLKPENNKIIRRWKKVGVQARNAMDSQGMLETYKNYCTKGKCLDCRIGSTLIKPDDTIKNRSR